MTEQVPASCTLPAAPPWPEEATHPLAPLPTVRQANGVETTQGSFYEVCDQEIPSGLSIAVNSSQAPAPYYYPRCGQATALLSLFLSYHFSDT